MKRKILIVSTSRADFDLLQPIISKLKSNRKIESKLMVSGSHFDKKFGYTYKNILSSGLNIDFKFKMDRKNLSKKHLIKSLSDYMQKLSFYIQRNYFDIILILGDRYETLVTAFIANFYNVPIAHISGGEITEGSQDDSYRHAISKLSNIHFVSHEIYKKRLMKMGEDKNNIFNFGSLGIENIQSIKFLNKTKTMTLIQYSLQLIDERGEITKQKLGSRITSEIIDEVTAELKNKMLMLLVIEGVRLN